MSKFCFLFMKEGKNKMCFVGIIVEGKQFEYIKNEIEKHNTNIKCIKIDEKNIENIKNIKFDTIVIDENLTKMNNSINYLQDIIQKAEYILINSDIEIEREVLDRINMNIITYGLNQKSTITLSSIKDDKMLVCIQRSIKTKNNSLVENGEMLIISPQIEVRSKYSLFVIFTVLLIYDSIFDNSLSLNI